MAEIYASQGHFDQALSVYRKIVERHPMERKYHERIEELQMLSSASSVSNPGPSPSADHGAARHQKAIRVLEQWLEAIRKSKGA